MNGIEEIIVERINQLDKHGYTVAGDVKEHIEGDLRLVAAALILNDFKLYPRGWNKEQFFKWQSEPRRKQLAIAGAFIAAEIDRVILISERNRAFGCLLDERFDPINVTWDPRTRK